MPTTIAITPRARAPRTSTEMLGIMESRDFTAVVGFSVVGLLLTIGVAVMFPLSGQWAALWAAAF